MEQKKGKSETYIKLGLSLGLALFVVVFTQEYFFSLGPLKNLEQKHLDERFLNRGAKNIKDTADVIIVEITQKTYDGIPERWPWPRSVYARAIKNLNEAGVRAIGIDIVMSTPDQISPVNDSTMIQSIRQYRNVVVGGKVEIDEGNQSVQTMNDGINVSVSSQVQVKRTDENYSSVYYKADSSIGIVQVPNDNDGVIRRYQPFCFSPTDDKALPSFGFAVLNKYYGLGSLHLAGKSDDYFVIGDKQVPRFDRTSVLVNYYGPSRTFKYYDLLDIIDDAEYKTKEELSYETDINTWDDPDYGYKHSGVFKDKIVLIGSTIPEDKDILPISFARGQNEGDNMIAGVEIHASIIQNIISGNFMHRQPRWLEIIATALLTIFSFYLSSLLKGIKVKFGLLLEIVNLAIIAGCFVGIRMLSFYLFTEQNYIINIVSANVAILIGYFGSSAYHFVTERKQKGMIKGMFSQYVNATIVDELITDPEKLQLGGQRKTLTVFFSDIAGFSTFSEKKEPEELITFLNEYLSAMTKCVFDNRGTLDKYIGDAVMAFWGAPIPLQNHAYLGVKSALEMQTVLAELNTRWQKEGQPFIISRMGINTGDMVVGNVGGTQRFDYTVMGDNVNLGSRLEGANKEYGTKIMIADSTYEMVKNDFITRELDFLVVKGRTIPIKVFEVLGFTNDPLDPKIADSVEQYLAGLELFRKQQFADAILRFERALAINPEEHPSSVYIKRSKHYIAEPPGPDWDGVFIMKTK